MSPAEIEAEKARVEALTQDGWSRPERASGGDILEWKQGLVVIGKLRKIKKLPDTVTVKDGKHETQKGGHIMTIATDEGDKVYGCPTLLHQTLEGVNVGTMLRIECLGQVVPTKRGQKAWDFEVSSKDQQNLEV